MKARRDQSEGAGDCRQLLVMPKRWHFPWMHEFAIVYRKVLSSPPSSRSGQIRSSSECLHTSILAGQRPITAHAHPQPYTTSITFLTIVHFDADMITLVAFDLDGTLAESKQPLKDTMGEALAELLSVANVAVISGGDWPQFQKQVASRLPSNADLSKLWLMPTTGTKLYTHKTGEWKAVYAELFSEDERKRIIQAFEASLEATGFKPEQTWGERIEDRGSQITFSALGQKAPVAEKEVWDPDFAKRKVIQADLRTRLPELSINMGGATSIDITQKGVDKGYGLKKLRDASGIPLEQMVFIGDAIFPGGNDYPAKELGLETVRVKSPDGTLAAIAGIVACLR